MTRRISEDWQELVVTGREFHDGGVEGIVHGLDLRTLQFTLERADSFAVTRDGHEAPRYLFRFSRVPVFSLRQVLPDDWDWAKQWDPLGRERNFLSWEWAELLSPDEVASFRPPTSDYQGMRVHLHPWAELVVVFHDLEIEFLGSAGVPWHQNPEGARYLTLEA